MAAANGRCRHGPLPRSLRSGPRDGPSPGTQPRHSPGTREAWTGHRRAMHDRCCFPDGASLLSAATTLSEACPDKQRRILEAAAFEFAARGSRAPRSTASSRPRVFRRERPTITSTTRRPVRDRRPGWLERDAASTDFDIADLDVHTFWPVLLGLYADMLRSAREQPWLVAVANWSTDHRRRRP